MGDDTGVAADVVDTAADAQVEEQRTPQQEAQWWCAEIQHALKLRSNWVERGRKVERLYHDQRDIGENNVKRRNRKFNVLWSNTETMRPAVYMQTPKPQASRRWRQRDPTGRMGSMLIERCLEVSCEEYDFDNVMDSAVRDRFLPGLGQAWIRYEPTFYQEQELDAAGAPAVNEKGDPVTYDAIDYEAVVCDYLRWDDYLTSPARTETEVEWKARRHYFGPRNGPKRFGKEVWKKVTLDCKPSKSATKEEQAGSAPPSRQSQAIVWEIWDKESGDVLFVAPGSGDNAILERKPAPIKFKGFFPCPRPMLATTTSESTLPSPDYVQYQDQAQELNEITARIDKLQKALKVAGLYDKSNTDLAKLLSSAEGEMIGVENWAMNAEAGGSASQIEWYPVEKVMAVLQQLYIAREQSKQILYEVSGIADVMRGATNPNETLGAQQLKARWGSGRVRKSQKDVQRFAGEVFALKAEVISEVFQFSTILEMADLDMETIAKYVPAGVNPQALLSMVEKMLRQDMKRSFKIKVQPDSTLEPDEQAERQWRTQFLTGMGALLKELAPLAQQGAEGAKLAGEMIMMGVRGFKEADQLEEIVEQAVDAAGKAAAAAAQRPPAPSPEMAEIQRKAQRDKGELQLKAQGQQMDAANDAADRRQEQQEFQVDTAIKLDEHRANLLNGAAQATERFDMADAM